MANYVCNVKQEETPNISPEIENCDWKAILSDYHCNKVYARALKTFRFVECQVNRSLNKLYSVFSSYTANTHT